jgi:hypothetical protein
MRASAPDITAKRSCKRKGTPEVGTTGAPYGNGSGCVDAVTWVDFRLGWLINVYFLTKEPRGSFVIGAASFVARSLLNVICQASA